MRPPVFAVVTGNIRNVAEFKLILARICHLRSTQQIDEIIFSTWHGEIDKLTGLRTSLASLGVTVVEDVLPTEAGMGHITVQQKSLWNGLSQCPDNSYVIKLRTDKIFRELFDMLPSMMSLIPHSLAPVEAIGTFPQINSNRIITSTSFSWPFRIQDIIFCGTKSDTLNLISFGQLHDGVAFPGVVAAEQRWFSYPFLLIPIIREYFASTNTQSLPEAVRTIQQTGHKSVAIPDFLIRLFITYYILFIKNFIAIQDSRFSDIDDQGRSHGRDAITTLIIEKVATNLLHGGWEAAVDVSTLRNSIERILDGEWRRSTLDRRCREELLVFESSAGLGRMFAFPKIAQVPAPKYREQSGIAIAKTLSSFAEPAPLGELNVPRYLVERTAAGDMVDFGKETLILAKSYWRGTGVLKDRKQAIRWLQVASDNYIPRAQILLGLACYHGIGVDQDQHKALQCLVWAACQLPRNLRVPRLIAEIFLQTVIETDTKLSYVPILAQSNNAHMKYLLADLYERGQGLEANPAQARALYASAADLGHRDAARRLEKIDRPRGPLRRALNWIKTF